MLEQLKAKEYTADNVRELMLAVFPHYVPTYFQDWWEQLNQDGVIYETFDMDEEIDEEDCIVPGETIAEYILIDFAAYVWGHC